MNGFKNFNNKKFTSNPGVEASILSAQYNNIATTPGQLAAIRGSGQYTTQGMSSNWEPGNLNPHMSTYVKKLNNDPIPAESLGYDISNIAPVAERKNDEFFYTPDQSSFPPGSKESLEGDPYLQFGLNAIKETPTSMSMLFFSRPNVKYIQKRIIEDIYNITGVKIKPQSENSIMIVMVNKYQYARAGSLPAQSAVHLALPRGEKSCSLKDRLSRLNQAALQDLIQQILSGMSMYATYYKDASSIPIPLDLPKLTTMKGSRVIPSGPIGMYDNEINKAKSITSFNMRDNIIN